jgi:hypothetical protein
MAPAKLYADLNEGHHYSDSSSSGGYVHTQHNTTSTQDSEKLKPLAIVGLDLKFPQDAVSSEALWEMLIEKKCAMTEYPKDRLEIDSFYHPDSNRRDTVRNHFLLSCLTK